MRPGLLALCLTAILAACMPQGGAPIRDPGDPLRPPGPVPGAVGIDPMIVGDRMLAAGEAELALETYVRAAADAGPTVETRLAMASANVALGRLGQAERLLRGIVAEAPRDAAARNDLGVVLFERGETGEAYQMFRTAFALQPSPEIRENLLLADARLRKVPYEDVRGGTFTLTRRRNGIYDLISPAPDP